MKIIEGPSVDVLRKSKRFDDEDYSTLFCMCGESFRWSSVDPLLNDWIEQHRSHVEKVA